MRLYRFFTARLAIHQTRELLAVAEQKFNLEARFVASDNPLRIQAQIGGKQQGMTHPA